MIQAITWTNSMVAELQRLADEGLSQGAIAKRMDLSPNSIHSAIGRFGIKIQPKFRWTHERTSLLRELYVIQNLHVIEISQRLGVTSAAVQRRATGLGFHRRKDLVVDRRPWRQKDLDEVREMAARLKDGIKSNSHIADEIARTIGRSPSSVFQKLWPAGEATERVKIPPEVLDAAASYSAARCRQSRISEMMGDPPPGYSALDQRRAAQ